MREAVNAAIAQPDNAEMPQHVAIIMDGNGRWAARRGLPRTHGHRAGVEATRRVIKAAGKFKIPYITLFGFSAENWKRPQSEVRELFSLIRRFIRNDLAELHKNNVRIRVIGSRVGIPKDICKLVEEAESLTAGNDSFNLIIAFNYGGRQEIVTAATRMAREIANGNLSDTEICQKVFAGFLDTGGLPDPDVIIRTSGENRISNFLLWQCAYSEFVFSQVQWPDFDEDAFLDALNEYRMRERRFGGLAASG